ncbi:MAG: TonB-dependent receptor [Bacteroidota bacterium]|nr:TonB-dependent receptor [Bacteroidota bacterium]
MKTVYKLFTMLTLVLFSMGVFAQGTIKGVVKDNQTLFTLVGATVIVEGTTTGATTDVDGKFSFEAPAGTHTLIVSYMGYLAKKTPVSVKNGQTTDAGIIKLEPAAIGLAGISIIADRAKPRETPVAFSTIDKKQLKEQLGSRDIPLAMNITPNVYSTAQGGGAGDARINVRGFDQSNVAIMINGVPVNDMENGWVYWSNWDGIGDATSSIQMQRGLSAVNLATPSIGGTMNVLTSPADQTSGVTYKQEFGSGTFAKSTLMAHTGLVDGKWALSVGGVRKTGTGVINKTWTDAGAYYLGASYNINAKNRLEFYAMGAPQRHGQNLYKQNIAAYDHEYAKDEFNYPDSALMKIPEAANGRFYNENWGPVSFRYKGKQWWNGKERDRFSEQFINERENYYHKPLVNLNWYSQLSEKLYLFTTAYYSGGKGGGSGTYGSVKWNYDGPSRMIDFDKTIANNTESDTAHGILRNSINNQWTVGLISKLRWDVSERFKLSVGIDGRLAEIDHFREVRDLLGGKFFYYDGNAFDSPSDYDKVLGDKIAYHFTNDVNWLGGYLQGEYSYDKFTAYATAGYSMIKYKYTNHFAKAENSDSKLTAETEGIGGYQVKGGLSYNLTETLNAFVNAGYVSKVPIFDAVINDRSGTVAKDPKNEKFTSFEGGLVYNTLDNRFWVSANFYFTTWKDRTLSLGVVQEDGTEGFVFITGMGQKHAGIEIEGNWRPIDLVGLHFAGSVNDWVYTDNVSGTYKDYENPDAEIKYNYYVKDLKVGDAPQTQLILGLTLYPVKGMRAQILSRYYADYFADWDPFTRTNEADQGDVWKIPSFNVFDLHFSYELPFQATNATFEVFAHVFNLFDTKYIQDATDNSPYNGYYGYDNKYSHQAPAAEVFLGLPRTYNLGVLINVR